MRTLTTNKITCCGKLRRCSGDGHDDREAHWKKMPLFGE